MSGDDSFIKNVTITRSDAANSQNRPLQVSQNQQFAINTTTHLTIFEPKLPSLNQGITAIKNVRILNPKDLFQIVNILTSELKEFLPIKNFSVLTFDNLDEPFTLANIDDPIVIQHQWSPNSCNTRDNYLGVLFNTGEMLILQRQTSNVDKYMVKFNLFERLVDQFNLGVDNDKNYVIPSSDIFLSLKIKTFAFSEIDSTLWLSLINANGDIYLYAEENDSLELKYEIHSGLDLVKQDWSNWKVEGDKLRSSHLSVIASDNSVYYYDFEYDSDSKKIKSSDVKNVSGTTRFKNSQNKWLESSNRLYLLNAFTGYIQVTDIKTSTTIKQKLESASTVSGIVSHIYSGSIRIIISYELGSFESFDFGLLTSQISKVSVDKAITTYVGKSLQSFQLFNASAEDTGNDDTAAVKKEDDSVANKNPNDTFRLYLDPNIEGQFVIYGMETIGEGVLALLYKIIPKNVLYYQTESQGEVEVAFIKLEDYQASSVSLLTSRTPLSYIIELWISKYNDIPLLITPRTGAEIDSMEAKIASIHKYIQDIKDFKQNNFLDITYESKYEGPLQGNIELDLPSNLLKYFNNNEDMFKHQLLLNFDRIIHNSLITIEAIDETLEKYINTIVREIDQIETRMKLHLSKIVLEFLDSTAVRQFTEAEKFFILQHHYHLSWEVHNDVLKKKNIDEAKITIKTKFFEETFELNGMDTYDQTFPKLITSSTNHEWSICQLTGFPLLQLNNRRDELGQINYILNNFSKDDIIINDVLTTIQFCYITGNRTFKLQ
ncbi:hypothetical protein DFJ63DRAFT_6516 [Scheffersomyces coipomensis]|uniref:uncharacterized protein n=1 Tax=Scheffersomyces coipomensis TaxID=1788519 RepID=UPI00315CEDCD